MKNFFIHLSMSLGFNINPKLWFQTDGYKLRESYRPQDIRKNDLMIMLDEMRDKGLMSPCAVGELKDDVSHLKDIDLKRIYVRSMGTQEVKDSFQECEDHDHREDFYDALKRFYKSHGRLH